MSKFGKYKHFLLYLYVPVYAAAFFIVEGVITNDSAFASMLLPVDYTIPFFEWAVIPYILWYPFMIAVAVYLSVTDARAFSRFMCYMMIGFSLFIVFSFIFPNGTAADFRPDTDALGRHNLATWLLNNFIWKNDTYTNVMPSLHVVGSLMAVFGFYDSKLRKHKALGCAASALAILIIISTMFVKQHAILDVIVGIVYSVILYFIVYVLIKRRADKKYERGN